MTESRKDGEDKRNVIKGRCVCCFAFDVAASVVDLKRRRTVGVEDTEGLNRPARLGAKEVPA